jgi:hypothetical protein
MDCSSLPNTQQKYFNINGLKIKVPSECMVADENSTAMTCISDNAAFFIGIKSSDSFQNILLSEHKKEVKNFYYGIFVELNYGENKLNFFKIKNSNIIITGDSKDFMLKFSRDVYNEMAASDPR